VEFFTIPAFSHFLPGISTWRYLQFFVPLFDYSTNYFQVKNFLIVYLLSYYLNIFSLLLFRLKSSLIIIS